MAHKYCYLFSEGNATMRELLGGKGANLAEMTNIGLPVPQGFTISTEACTKYYEDGRKINDEIMAEINEYIVKMEGITGKKFGDKVIENSADLAMYLLEEGHVATVGGAAFCAPECLRFSYATSDENLKEALHRIKEALAKLK